MATRRTRPRCRFAFHTQPGPTHCCHGPPTSSSDQPWCLSITALCLTRFTARSRNTAQPLVPCTENCDRLVGESLLTALRWRKAIPHAKKTHGGTMTQSQCKRAALAGALYTCLFLLSGCGGSSSSDSPPPASSNSNTPDSTTKAEWNDSNWNEGEWQ